MPGLPRLPNLPVPHVIVGGKATYIASACYARLLASGLLCHGFESVLPCYHVSSGSVRLQIAVDKSPTSGILTRTAKVELDVNVKTNHS